MEKALQNRLSGCIRQVVSTLQLRAETDQALIQRFVVQRDEAAFAAVVRRHGPMVLRVASRTLQNEHDAEDVFQATFLVLSQKAHTLRRQESLGSWLYGIAYRLALKSKAMAGARRKREQRPAMTHVATPLAQITVQEAQEILDEEISRLPEKFREPVVLCCLEGLARDEAAHQIGCTAGALKGRLELARERLHQRLVARGLTLPCGLGAFLLLEGVVRAAVLPALISSTTKAAIAVAAGKAATTVVTAKVVALTEGALRTMFLSKLKIATAALVLGSLVTGATMLTSSLAMVQAKQPPAAVGPAQEPPKEEKEAFTAWGKEVGGLQAGLGFRPGERRVYRIGETITFVVRIRNVGKKDVKIESLSEFFFENAPSITDGDGKPVSLEQPIEFSGIPAALMQEDLAPGKGAVLCELDLKLRPASEKGTGRPWVWTLYETGKFQVQFEKVGGNIGKVGAGIGTGAIRFDPILSKLATGKLELEVKEPEKEPFTAWGKKVGRLQAGLGFRPGAKRAYSHGETVPLVVRVRNVSKEDVRFEYINAFFIVFPPAVTDARGKPIPQAGAPVSGRTGARTTVSLAPGKEIELYERKLVLGPEFGTGKIQIQYKRVFPPRDPREEDGSGIAIAGVITLDPTEGKLATGKLEVEIKADAPKQQGTRTGGAAVQDIDPEKLYRTMEKTVRAAKSLHVALDSEVDSPAMKGTAKATIHTALGNKSRMELDIDVGGKAEKLLFVTDGQARYTKQGDKGTLDPNPKKAEQEGKLVPGTLARIGITGAILMARSAKPGEDKEFDLDKDAPVKDFKLGAKEMVGAKTAQVVTYQLDFDGTSAKMSVWIDTKTQLPLKRVVTAEQAGQMFRVTETYSTFALDPKLEPKLFEIPKE